MVPTLRASSCAARSAAGRIDAIAPFIVAEAVFVPEGLVMADTTAIGRNRLGLLIHRLQAGPLTGVIARAGLWLRAHHGPAIRIDGSLGVDGASGTDQTAVDPYGRPVVSSPPQPTRAITPVRARLQPMDQQAQAVSPFAGRVPP